MPEDDATRVAPPDPRLEVLARAALAVHGPSDVDAKLAWIADAARSLTGAPFAAYVSADEGSEPVLSGRLPPALAALARAALDAARGAAEGRALRRRDQALLVAAVPAADTA